jgi:uncharacterized protein YndB with AHSA1/START domain
VPSVQRNEHTVEIEASPRRVFELLSQPASMREWVGGLREFNALDPGPAPGARAVQVLDAAGRRWRIESQIVRYEPPHELESILRHRAFESRVAYRLAGAGGRTHLTGTIETRYQLGVGRLLGGLIGRQAQRKLEDDLGRLKRLAEAA